MMAQTCSETLLASYEEQLAILEGKGLRRSLRPRRGYDFSSNDYLALAASEDLHAAVAEAVSRGVPVGSSGSRLLRGNHYEHEALEEDAAQFFGAESALYFSSGYSANSALLSTLPQLGDLIVNDELIHASSREGIRLSRSPSRAASHNDVQSFADILRSWRDEGGRGRPWIVVESLYSMDGDKAPLSEFVALADEHDAFLVIDEAHATGVFGKGGRGLAEGLDGRDNVITVRTCGKALGCEGALVCASATLRDFMINRCRGFIFSTASSPLMAAAARYALRLIEEDGARQQRVHELFALAGRLLEPLGANYRGSQILPLIIGDAARAMRLAQNVQEAGFDVRGIRPPTVPEGRARVRISITLNVDAAAISALADAIGSAIP